MGWKTNTILMLGLVGGTAFAVNYCHDDIGRAYNDGKEKVEEFFGKEKEEPVKVEKKQPAMEELIGQVDHDFDRLKRSTKQVFYRVQQKAAKLPPENYTPDLDAVSSQYREHLAYLMGGFVEDALQPQGKAPQELQRRLQHINKQLTKDICQPEVAKLRDQVYLASEELFAGHLDEKSQQKLKYTRAVADLDAIGQEKLGDMASQVAGRLGKDGYDSLIQSQPLEFWINGLQKNYDVQFKEPGNAVAEKEAPKPADKTPAGSAGDGGPPPIKVE